MPLFGGWLGSAGDLTADLPTVARPSFAPDCETPSPREIQAQADPDQKPEA